MLFIGPNHPYSGRIPLKGSGILAFFPKVAKHRFRYGGVHAAGLKYTNIKEKMLRACSIGMHVGCPVRAGN
jgi:hypothetical protein